MKKTKLRTILSFLFSFIVVFTACKNTISQPEETADSCKYTIYIQAPSKTASPVLPDNIWYTLIAAFETDVGEDKKINAVYNQDGILQPARPDEYYPNSDKVKYSYILTSNFPGTNYFTMELPYNGTWYFYIEGYTSNETRNDSTRILTGRASKSAKNSHYSVTLPVDFIPGGTGKVKLPIDVSRTTINRLQISNTGDGILDGTYYRVGDIIPIDKSNIPAGTYEAKLTFSQYDEDDGINTIIFSILNETINVKENFETNSWIYSENCEYLKKKNVTHALDDTADPPPFPPSERLITETADFIVTPEYLYKKCNNFCYVSVGTQSKPASNANIGSSLKPFKSIDYALKRTVVLNENFNLMETPVSDEKFTIYIDGILFDAEHPNEDYNAPEAVHPVSILFKPTTNNSACEVFGNLIFGKNYNITIDSGVEDSKLAQEKFVFRNNIETQSPISINNCTISGNLTLNNINNTSEKTSTIYKSVIGSSSQENGQVDITVNNSKLSFINPDTEASDRGSYTKIALNNLNITNGGSVEIFDNTSEAKADMNIYNTLAINNSNFKIWSTTLKTQDIQINNCTSEDSVFFDSATNFTANGVYTATNSKVRLNSTDHFETKNGFTADGGQLTVYNSSISSGGSGIVLKNNCNANIDSTEDDINTIPYTITGKVTVDNSTVTMKFYRFEAGSELFLTNNAVLTGERLDIGFGTKSDAMNIVSIANSTVNLTDTKLYFKNYMEINDSEFSLTNTAKRGRKTFSGLDGNSFTIIGKPNSSTQKTVSFDNVAMSFLNISNIPLFLNSKNNEYKKIIFKNTDIEINNSAFTGDAFIDENTDITFTNTRIPGGNLLVNESSQIIFNGETIQENAASRIYLENDAKLNLQNPPTSAKTYARIIDLNPIDNEGVIVLLNDNKEPTDFSSDFTASDSRYTIQNVGFKLSYDNYNSVRSGILTYDTALKTSLPSGWGARIRNRDLGTSKEAIIGAKKAGNDYDVPATSSYTLANAKTIKIIGGLWNNSTRWSGNQFQNANIPEINYTLFFGNEILHSQTSISTSTDPQAATNSEFILSDWDPDIDSRFGSQNSIQYNIRMTFSLKGTYAGSYTCNIPLIVTKN